jgi:hypothetical protein
MPSRRDERSEDANLSDQSHRPTDTQFKHKLAQFVGSHLDAGADPAAVVDALTIQLEHARTKAETRRYEHDSDAERAAGSEWR